MQMPEADNIPTDELIFHLIPLQGEDEMVKLAEERRESLLIEMAARLERDEHKNNFRNRLIRLVVFFNLDRSPEHWANTDRDYYPLYCRFKSQQHTFLSQFNEEVIMPNDVDSRFLGWDATIESGAIQGLDRRFFNRR